MTETLKPNGDIQTLLSIMTALRDPVNGCPWDLEQNFDSVVRYTIEEAYEVCDAIERRDMADLKDELGDLLLQVAFHARMAEEQGYFKFSDVVDTICTKMLRRHPHVFGDLKGQSSDDINALWASIKQQEKLLEGERPNHLLDEVPPAFPALIKAQKLQEKAASVGFDWNDPKAVLEKIVEEASEITEARHNASHEEIEDEVGDLLFAVVNLARHLKVDAETALARTNAKFTRRFGYIEDALAHEGRSLAGANLDEMEALWIAAKGDEKQ